MDKILPIVLSASKKMEESKSRKNDEQNEMLAELHGIQLKWLGIEEKQLGAHYRAHETSNSQSSHINHQVLTSKVADFGEVFPRVTCVLQTVRIRLDSFLRSVIVGGLLCLLRFSRLDSSLL